MEEGRREMRRPMTSSVAGLMTGIRFFRAGSLHSPSMNSIRLGTEITIFPAPSSLARSVAGTLSWRARKSETVIYKKTRRVPLPESCFRLQLLWIINKWINNRSRWLPLKVNWSIKFLDNKKERIVSKWFFFLDAEAIS